jgi:hypothetical protein
MSKLTTSQFATKIGLSIPQTKKLLREGIIHGEKIDPSKRTSAYLIPEREAERYQKASKSRVKAVKRCEPCQHQPKKLCASCKRPICIKDYRKTREGLPAAKCKDCENKRKRENRNKLITKK